MEDIWTLLADHADNILYQFCIDVCRESISWICNSCERLKDVTYCHTMATQMPIEEKIDSVID
jgi:hypothetical protein